MRSRLLWPIVRHTARQLDSACISWAKACTEACALGGRAACTASETAILVAMPKLSPSMSSGKIVRWCKQPGDQVATYDILLEVETSTLVEEQNKLGDMEGSVVMLVESQEDVYLQRILVGEGQDVRVGKPIAVACDFEDEQDSLSSYQPPTDDLLADSSMARTLVWQAYLKSGSPPSGCT